MRNLNMAVVHGRLGKDPELKETANKISVVDFNIANNRDYKDKDGNDVQRVNWISCRAYKGLAETICKYLHKGSKVGIVGEVTVDQWEDKETKSPRSRTYILVTELEFLDSKSSDSSGQTSPPPAQAQQEYTSVQYEPYDAAEDVF